jgi:putative spermidine/putrescine transport system ATP-binding protein
MSQINFINVSKSYVGKPAVDKLNLEIKSGEFVSLLGPSGCGKTTSLRMLAGFLEPDDGDIQLANKSVLGLGAEVRPTAMVFQRYTLFPHMNIFHNVAFGLKLRKLEAQKIRDHVGRMLELVGLPGFEKRYPAQLSGGQQQRIALARALVVEPQVLLLDEPLSSLDARLRVNLREEIRAIQRQLGITTVFVTHDQEEALAVSDRIAVMNEGVLQQYAAPDELYARPATLFAAQFIGSMNLISGRIVGGWLEAGAFRIPVPNLEPQSITLAVRPEDLEFAAASPFALDNVSATLEGVTELGHYRSLRVKTGQSKLTVFAARGTMLDALSDARLWLRRALVYTGDKLLTELIAEPHSKIEVI